MLAPHTKNIGVTAYSGDPLSSGFNFGLHNCFGNLSTVTRNRADYKTNWVKLSTINLNGVKKMFNGPKMREIRKQKRLSMAEVAKEIGVSEAYLSMLETGKRECPDGKVLYLLAKKLNCEAGDLTDDPDLLHVMHAMFGNPKSDKKASDVKEDQASPYTVRSDPCPACAAKDKEIDWLRSTITNLQENFKNALSAIERKHQP